MYCTVYKKDFIKEFKKNQCNARIPSMLDIKKISSHSTVDLHLNNTNPKIAYKRIIGCSGKANFPFTLKQIRSNRFCLIIFILFNPNPTLAVGLLKEGVGLGCRMLNEWSNYYGIATFSCEHERRVGLQDIYATRAVQYRYRL